MNWEKLITYILFNINNIGMVLSFGCVRISIRSPNEQLNFVLSDVSMTNWYKRGKID